MHRTAHELDFEHLSVSDRLEMIERIWNSIEAEGAALPVPDWHVRGLDARRARFERDLTTLSLDEVSARVDAALQRK